MEDLKLGVSVAGAICGVLLGLLVLYTWGFAFAGVQFYQSKKWMCEQTGGGMYWQVNEAGKWYQDCQSGPTPHTEEKE